MVGRSRRVAADATEPEGALADARAALRRSSGGGAVRDALRLGRQRQPGGPAGRHAEGRSDSTDREGGLLPPGGHEHQARRARDVGLHRQRPRHGLHPLDERLDREHHPRCIHSRSLPRRRRLRCFGGHRVHRQRAMERGASGRWPRGNLQAPRHGFHGRRRDVVGAGLPLAQHRWRDHAGAEREEHSSSATATATTPSATTSLPSPSSRALCSPPRCRWG